MLMELFQRLVSTEGMTITRRKIFRENGQIVAEVDVFLEGHFGSSSMSVAIECRDRNKPGGTTWIQQIIGKRDSLRRFGVKHWIAVSASGFTEPAMKIAQSAGIELMVLGDVQPVNPQTVGPHQLMRFQMVTRKWIPGTIKAEIAHESDSVLDQIEKDIAQYTWGVAEIGVTESELRPLVDLLEKHAQEEFGKVEKAGAQDNFIVKTALVINEFCASIRGQKFQLQKFTIEIELQKATLKPEFKMITFINPLLRQFLGFIGLNSVEAEGETIHMMVAVKPGNPGQLIGAVKNGRGEPISGATILLPSNFGGYKIGV